MYIISGCLLGFPCKYDGTDNGCEWVKEFAAFNDYVAVCPEVAGGLDVPRPPAEQVWIPVDKKAADSEEPQFEEQVKILNEEGQDVTEAFFQGARASLEKVLQEAEKRKFETMSISPTNMADGIIEGAILKAHSPSCGSGKIYDGTFTRTLTAGDGVFAALLKAHGIPVYTEEDGNHFGYEEEK